MATAPLRSGFAETSSSRRVLGSPLSYSVGPWPAILGWTRNLYSSIRSSRSNSVASLPLPRSTPAGVASLSFCTPLRRSPAMWWLLVHGKFFRVDDTTYFALASSLTAHSRIAGGASSSPRATAGQLRRVRKACVSSSAILSWWSTQPSTVTLMLKVKSPMRRGLLKTLVSNCTFDRGSLLATYRKPFDMLVEGNENGNWLGGRD